MICRFCGRKKVIGQHLEDFERWLHKQGGYKPHTIAKYARWVLKPETDHIIGARAQRLYKTFQEET